MDHEHLRGFGFVLQGGGIDGHGVALRIHGDVFVDVWSGSCACAVSAGLEQQVRALPADHEDGGVRVAAGDRGDVFFGDPALFAGTIALLVDGAAPMGSVTISRARTRNVRVACTGLPAGGVVRVVQGTVDLAGPAVPEPGTTANERPAADWRRGYVDLSIDTSSPRFVRVEVRTGAGQVIALSNPVWLPATIRRAASPTTAGLPARGERRAARRESTGPSAGSCRWVGLP